MRRLLESPHLLLCFSSPLFALFFRSTILAHPDPPVFLLHKPIKQLDLLFVQSRLRVQNPHLPGIALQGTVKDLADGRGLFHSDVEADGLPVRDTIKGIDGIRHHLMPQGDPLAMAILVERSHGLFQTAHTDARILHQFLH